MKRILASAVGGAAALAVILGAGPAVADNEYKGQTYSTVQEWTNGRAVIASRTGSYLPTEECIVTGNRKATYGTGSVKILVDLNCNDTMTAGHPGYSAASPQGQKAQKRRDQAAWFSSDFAKALRLGRDPYCATAVESCIRICQEARSCSDELVEYLGI